MLLVHRHRSLLNLAALDWVPLHPAVHLRAVEHRDFPAALAEAEPTIMHAIRTPASLCAEHDFIDTTAGAAARLVLTYDFRDRRVLAHVAEVGPRGLWDRIVVVATEWNRRGRGSIRFRKRLPVTGQAV